MPRKNRQSIKNMTDESVLDMNFFQDDLEELYEDADSVKELADKINDDIDNIYYDKSNRELIGRGIMPFVANQVKSLSELRSSKAMITNQALTAKLKISQLALSKKKGSDDSNTELSTMAREFNKLFMEHNKELNQDPVTQYKNISESNNYNEKELLNEQIEKLKKDGKITLTDNEQVIKYEKRGVEFKISKSNPHIFKAFAKDNGECLDDYPITLLPKGDLNKAIFINNECTCENITYKLF